jgi:hypothetical protein
MGEMESLLSGLRGGIEGDSGHVSQPLAREEDDKTVAPAPWRLGGK